MNHKHISMQTDVDKWRIKPKLTFLDVFAEVEHSLPLDRIGLMSVFYGIGGQ